MPRHALSLYGFLPRDEALEHARVSFFPESGAADPVARWQRARDRLQTMKRAGNPNRRSLPAFALEHLEAVRTQPGFSLFVQGSYTFEEVEIAPLLTASLNVVTTHVDELRSLVHSDGATLREEDILDLCLPRNPPGAPTAMSVEQGLRGPSAFTLLSENTNLRVLSAEFGRDPEIGWGFLKFQVGLGNPHVLVAELDGKVIVQNGVHRLFLLLANGIEYAPCVVHKVNTWDQFGFMGPGFFRRELVLQHSPTMMHYQSGEAVLLPQVRKLIRFPVEEINVLVDSLPTESSLGSSGR